MTDFKVLLFIIPILGFFLILYIIAKRNEKTDMSDRRVAVSGTCLNDVIAHQRRSSPSTHPDLFFTTAEFGYEYDGVYYTANVRVPGNRRFYKGQKETLYIDREYPAIAKYRKGEFYFMIH